MTIRRGLGPIALLGLLVALAALVFAASASAKEIRKPLGPLGSVNQVSFVRSEAIAIDQGTQDVYVASGGGESQSVTISATAGQFRLKFKGETTADIAFNAPAGNAASSVQTALSNLPSIGSEGVFVSGGPGDGTGSQPYVISFHEALRNTDVEQLSCENGATPLSGGSGCAVATIKDGESERLTRWNPDGTPADFSALGTNVIDGSGPGEDQTPSNELEFITGVAVDNSGGASDGNVYVSQADNGSLHLVDVFASSGKYLGQLTQYKEGPTASGPLAPLNFSCGVAVDQAGDVYVGDTTHGTHADATLAIHKYHPTANPVANADNVANFDAGSLNTLNCALAAGAGPTAGYIFSNGSEAGKFGSEREVFKLDSSTGERKFALQVKSEEGQVGPLKGVTALAVDPANGRVLAGSRSAGEILEYDASGTSAPLPRFTLPLASEPVAVAVDGTSGNLYVVRQSSPQVDVYGPLLIVPDVSTEAPSEVTGISATLNGTISAATGPNASCHFQYTTEAAYLADKAISGHDGFAGAASVPCEPAGPFSGSTTNAVAGKATGLSAESIYRYRIVGENTNGENPGEAKTLETLGAPLIKGGEASEVTISTATISGEVNPRGLPTDFGVEYVSEADFKASGYAKATTTSGASQVSGTGFSPVSVGLSGLAPGVTYHFRLIASNGAGTALPGEDNTFATFAKAIGLPDGRAYEQVSPVTKLSEVFPPVGLGQSAGLGGTCGHCVPGSAKQRMPMQPSPEGDAMAYEGGPFAEGMASGIDEYVANRGAGGWATTALSGPQYGEEDQQGFKAFSTDLSRGVLYQIEPSLTADAPPDYANLYAWRAGAALEPMVTEAPPHRAPGHNSTHNNDSFRITYAGANAGTGTSAAFSHVIFQANDALTGEVPGIAPDAPVISATQTDLYEWTAGQLRLVNVLPGNNAAAANAVIGSGTLAGIGGAETYDFDHAISDDGSRIFWSERPSGQVYVREGATTTLKVPDPGKFLTASTDGSKVLLNNGHVFDLEDESIADLTEGLGGFQGTLGASDDLSRVYFVDTKALTPPTEENANGEHAEEGGFNLYLAEGGNVIFIGAVLVSDNAAGNGPVGTWRASPGSRLAQVSPDGRYLAFESTASLTGYDNKNIGVSVCVSGCFEVFEYDADAASLACASCNPTGEPPLGLSNLSLIESNQEPFLQPQNLPDEGEGRIFFESQDTLSEADKNGHIQDVYQWTPGGVGGCGLSRGCVALISSGQSAHDTQFVNATPSGDDAFIATWDALVPFDKDDLMDLYDARVGGGFEFSAAEPCLGEACKGPSSAAAELESPGTSSFSEPVTTPKPGCKKGSVKKRGRCVVKKKQKKHHKSHKRAAKHNKGGAK